jgi:hypothetical protein
MRGSVEELLIYLVWETTKVNLGKMNAEESSGIPKGARGGNP